MTNCAKKTFQQVSSSSSLVALEVCSSHLTHVIMGFVVHFVEKVKEKHMLESFSASEVNAKMFCNNIYCNSAWHSVFQLINET